MSKKSSYFDDLIKELTAKIEQLESGIKSNLTPTRRELEQFVWKTGRVVRLLIKPETDEARKIFWSETKGILKDVMVVEKFNPGSFTSSCVREDVLEKGLLLTLTKLLKYTESRKRGSIAAPNEVQTMETAAKKAKLKEEKEQTEKEVEENKKKYEYAGLAEKWSKLADFAEKWDEVDTDPDEPCPDIKQHGNCSYGRQCCFCNAD
mmetsp:Transcript_38832/g.77004  ORF Transcript_38832/g.77004 Transcript_38832/m.77004 type:complete len:206 (-) Transcript_38832:161-778(-)